MVFTQLQTPAAPHEQHKATESSGHCLHSVSGLSSSTTLLYFHRQFPNSSSDLREVHFFSFTPCQERHLKHSGGKHKLLQKVSPTWQLVGHYTSYHLIHHFNEVSNSYWRTQECKVAAVEKPEQVLKPLIGTDSCGGTSGG